MANNNASAKPPVAVPNAFGDKVMISELGLVLNRSDIAGYAFSHVLAAKQEIVREFSQAGIFYKSDESVVTSLRIYLGGNAPAIAQSLGFNVISKTVEVGEQPLPEIEVEDEDEDGAGEDAEQLDAVSSAWNTEVYYLEYPITSVMVGNNVYSVQQHPKYLELEAVLDEETGKLENKSRMEKRVRLFVERAGKYGSIVDFTPDEEEEDLQGDGMSNAPRITDYTKQAALEAHRAQQDDLRTKLVATLDFFHKNLIGIGSDGVVLTPVTLTEVKQRFGDLEVEGQKLDWTKVMQDELAEAVIAI